VPTFFDEGQSVTAPWHPKGDDVTMMIWVQWQKGAGPLVKTQDGAWAFPYDHDGFLAFKVGGEGQVTSKPVSDVRDRWAFYALVVDSSRAVLWIDGEAVDTLNATPAKPQEANLSVMEDAIGNAAHFAVWERPVSEDELRKIWLAGKNDPELSH
jgi:Concanavalin A-like lectin/glucanases superfamily